MTDPNTIAAIIRRHGVRIEPDDGDLSGRREGVVLREAAIDAAAREIAGETACAYRVRDKAFDAMQAQNEELARLRAALESATLADILCDCMPNDYDAEDVTEAVSRIRTLAGLEPPGS